MHQIIEVTGTGIPLLIDDIDTDRIIPARFLRCVTFDGLGEHSFEDDRQQDRNHPFDNPRYKGASVLIGGRNFGCGSSREHAPQALMRWGIAAIIAESFAEIFFGNCTTLGVPCVCASRSDLEQQQVRAGELTVPVTIPESARMALTTGKWDFLGQLLEGTSAVRQTASTLPYLSGFQA